MAGRCGVSLTGGRAEAPAAAWALSAFSACFTCGASGSVGASFRNACQRLDRRRCVLCGLSRLAELDLRGRVLRVQDRRAAGRRSRRCAGRPGSSSTRSAAWRPRGSRPRPRSGHCRAVELANALPNGVVVGGPKADAGDSCSRHLLLGGGVVVRVVGRERAVLGCELGERALVLRPQRGVALERAHRVLRPLLLLVGGREVAPGRRVVRVLRDLLLQARDRRAAARAEVEGVLERVADPGRAGADAEEDEAERERRRRAARRPTSRGPGGAGRRAPPATAAASACAELPLRCEARAFCAGRRLRCCVPLATAAPRFPSGSGCLPSTIVSSTRSGEPPKTTAAAGSSTGW